MVLIKEISPSYGFIVGNVLGRPYAAPIFSCFVWKLELYTQDVVNGT